LQSYGDLVSTQLARPEGQPGLKYCKNGDREWTDCGIPSPSAQVDRIRAQAEPFADFLHGRRGPICTAQEGRDSLRLVLACYLSAREGCRVRIDDRRVYEI